MVTALICGLGTQEQMDAAEIYWIDYFDCIGNGYNLKPGGYPSHGRWSEEMKSRIRGRHCSVETKARMSIAQMGNRHNLGKHLSDEAKRKIGQSHLGKSLSDEHRHRLSESHLGIPVGPCSTETRAKISLANRGRKFTPEQRILNSRCHGGRPFVDQNGVIYENQTEVAYRLGLQRSCIQDVLAGRQKATGGYTFRYIEVTSV